MFYDAPKGNLLVPFASATLETDINIFAPKVTHLYVTDKFGKRYYMSRRNFKYLKNCPESNVDLTDTERIYSK